MKSCRVRCLLITILGLVLAVFSQPRPTLNYCSPTTAVPLPIGCPSCDSRCGHVSGTNKTLCSCDKKCVVYGDCCEDFWERCPHEGELASNLGNSIVNLESLCIHHAPWSSSSGSGSFRVVSTCLDGSACQVTDRHHLNLFVPVVDVESGLHYMHAKCAMCNKVQKARPWYTNVSCDTKADINITSTIKLHELIKSKICQIKVGLPPEGFGPRACLQDAVSHCSPDCANQELIEQCNGATQSYTSALKLFKNYYCQLCSNLSSFETPKCGVYERGIPPLIGESPTMYGGSLTIIFDFNPSDGLQLYVEPNEIKCPPNQVWVPAEDGCRQIACPPDHHLLEGICSSLNFNESIIITVIHNNSRDTSKVLSFLDEPTWNNNVANDIRTTFETHFPNNGTIVSKFEITGHNALSINATTLLIISIIKNATFNTKSLNKLTMLIKDKMTVLLFDALLQLGIKQDLVDVVFGNNSMTLPGPLSSCTWLVYNEAEYEVNGSILVLSKTGLSYNSSQYMLLSDSAFICMSLMPTDTTVAYPDYSKPLEIIALICTILSIVCLLARMVLQFLFSYFHSFAGRLQFHLCLALFLAYLFMLIGGALAGSSSRGSCYALGVLTYTAFLAAFGWMTAIALNTWIVFRPSSSFIKADDKSQSLRKYIIIGWILPILLALLVLGLDFSSINPHFRADFGHRLCWFNQRYSQLVFFGIPVACSIIINSVLFVIVLCVLRKTFKAAITTTTTGTSQQQHFGIYFRLFILMGVSWSLGFIASFSGNLVIWIIFIVLNASQGVFIFVSFVCRKPILKMIFKRWLSPDDKSTSTGSNTKSSALMSGTENIPLSLRENRRE